MSRLAIAGGKPVRSRPFPPYNTIGEEEKRAVAEVLDSTVLSKFLGTWSPDFYGGPRVQSLEREWAEYFGVDFAVSVNSATSGLYAAVGAAGVGPGDEVIVSPYSMSASATAALVWGAVPVFADIDPDTFCISPETVLARLTPYTKAIIVVDLFGHPADVAGIMTIARDHSLIVIEDASQAPGARVENRFAGALADMAVFSLNYHKVIHSGEGGVVTTSDPRFAERLQLIRNHAEAVVEAKGVEDITNMVGFNYRMTEIEAAIASEQLKKLERLLAERILAANHVSRGLEGVPGLTTPAVQLGVRHAYYVYAMRYDSKITGVSRDRFAAAIEAEGIPISQGYVKPIYLQPLYQRRIAFGRDGFPFSYPGYGGNPDYRPGLCPVTERMHDHELVYTTVCRGGIAEADLDDVIAAFCKVTDYSAELR